MKLFSRQFLGVILVLALGGLALFQYQELRSLKSNPQLQLDEQAREYVKKVEKLIVLPEGEYPSVAVVNDPEKLKDQLFFNNVKKDDVLLTFPKSLKAILYDPFQNKIVNYGSINISKTKEPKKDSLKP